MAFILQPWQLLVTILAAWINHHQQQVIDFQRAQIEALLKAQGKKRILLNDDQRRVLAIRAKALGRKTLNELTTIASRQIGPAARHFVGPSSVAPGGFVASVLQRTLDTGLRVMSFPITPSASSHPIWSYQIGGPV